MKNLVVISFLIALTTAAAAQDTSPLPPAPAAPLSAESDSLILEDGAPVKLRLLRELSSTKEQPGATVEFAVIEEVKVGSLIVIARDATAIGTVLEARPARRLGRTGKLDVRVDVVQLTNGKKARLRAIRRGPDGSRAGEVAMTVAAAGLLFFPVAPLLLLQKGENIHVPQGTLVTAFIHGEHTLPRAEFK